MMRDVANRYRGLPPRTPNMLFLIVDKFYRGAVSHYDLIQAKKRDVARALSVLQETGDREPLSEALRGLFCEFPFYVTCWLQIDLALYRLAMHEETKEIAEVWHRYRHQIQRHLHVRALLDDTEACVERQFAHFQSRLASMGEDRYWFDGVYFSVDQASLQSLHSLYQAIRKRRPN